MASFFVSGILIDQNHSFHKRNIEFENKIGDIKFSGIYTNITIDDSPGSPNNWDWAKTQPWCSGSGIITDPYVIQGHTLKIYRLADGIRIINSNSSYFTIRNCNLTFDTSKLNGVLMTGIFLSNTTKGQIINNTIYDLSKGIHLNFTQDVQIVNNTIYDHPQEGILLEYSRYIDIIKNRINNTSNGISLLYSNNTLVHNNSMYSNLNGIQISNSKYNEIYENIALNNDDGIFVENSENNTIKENKLNNNFDNGLRMIFGHNNTILENEIISNTQHGIDVSNSNDNLIFGNKIQNNDNGINLYVSDYNIIFENSIDTNNNIGIFAAVGGGDSDYNLVYWNFFTGNVIHAIDATSTNYWNNTYIGNYWDNYIGVDADHNGIGDTNHSFNGGIDYLPIWDLDLPSINVISPSDNDLVGRTAPSFIVEVTDVYLEDMWYTLDVGVNNVLFTTNDTFDQTLWETIWDNIAEMNMIYIIFYANDTFGHLGSNNVSVIKSVAPIITIISPLEDTIFGAVAPNFTVEVVESNLELMWYSVDGGLTNFLFITNGSISQSLWDSLPEGGALIRFYANDSLGNLVFEQVHIFKEIPVSPPPTIGIDFISTSLILLIAITGSIISILSGILKRKRKNL